jgi:formylmethanofuran dehydrogenase subunit B
VTSPLAADPAASTIAAARRVLVTGGGLAAATAARACDLAEALGAAVDFGGLETSQVAGPTIARIGELSADPEELRDRADLVVVWWCGPRAAAAGFLGRFVTPATAGGGARRVIVVGPPGPATSTPADHLSLPADRAVDLARLVQATLAGRATTVPSAALAAAADALHTAVSGAGCVAFVTDHRERTGLEAWSLAGLVRALAAARPAFTVPLEPTDPAAAVCTWRYGAAGAIARADRGGAEFRPAECDAARLVARGEVDCVVAVGTLAEHVEAALAARSTAVHVIRVTGDDAAILARLDALVAGVTARAPA